MSKRIRTRDALGAVELDQVQFANAVAKGELTCLPPTERGSARLFALTDLIPLWIFARLTEGRGDHARERFSAKEAGKVADRVGRVLQANPDADHVVVVTHMNDLIVAHPMEQTEPLSSLLARGDANGIPLRDIRVWDVRNIRTRCRGELENNAIDPGEG